MSTRYTKEYRNLQRKGPKKWKGSRQQVSECRLGDLQQQRIHQIPEKLGISSQRTRFAVGGIGAGQLPLF